jgi:Ca-activated chloride channel family protein
MPESAALAKPASDYNNLQDESYKKYEENTFHSTASDPLSTFSADVDAASYNIAKRTIMSGIKLNPDSVRIEEFLNYFEYSYPQPQGSDPVSINFEYTDSPWNKGLKLVKIGLKAKDIEEDNLPPSNLVFLIDVSGSMYEENRLPLVKKSLRMLVNRLRPQDKVSVVIYANGVAQLLSGVSGNEKEKIMLTIDNLIASGGTSGSSGLALAYQTAKENFIRKGNNRVILATDGDFNIGPRSESELENQITEARDSGVFLSVLGYGMGNYKDSKVQTLANKGNGNYAYINDLLEAKKTLVKEFGSTLFTVAKDVKLQVEFNPAHVAAYRLIGYEKRNLNTQDFNDDKKDAGEIGAGHRVTAIYEIIPVGVKSKFMPDVESLKYTKTASADGSSDVLTLKLRYKEPDSDTSKLMEKQLKQTDYIPFEKSSDDMRFAASVAQFGQILKNSEYKGEMTVEEVINTSKKAKGPDYEGYRSDFIKMVEMYQILK